MRFKHLQRTAALLAMAPLLFMARPGWGEDIAAMRLAPEEIELAADPSRPGGMAMATQAGAMDRPGLYSARIRIPAQLMIQPHTHPENRLVVVLSGTLHLGYGGRFEPARMKALPPGSFFTEPAGQPHFAQAGNTDVVVQVSGIGPSGTAYLQTGQSGD